MSGDFFVFKTVHILEDVTCYCTGKYLLNDVSTYHSVLASEVARAMSLFF